MKSDICPACGKAALAFWNSDGYNYRCTCPKCSWDCGCVLAEDCPFTRKRAWEKCPNCGLPVKNINAHKFNDEKWECWHLKEVKK